MDDVPQNHPTPGLNNPSNNAPQNHPAHGYDIPLGLLDMGELSFPGGNTETAVHPADTGLTPSGAQLGPGWPTHVDFIHAASADEIMELNEQTEQLAYAMTQPLHWISIDWLV